MTPIEYLDSLRAEAAKRVDDAHTAWIEAVIKHGKDGLTHPESRALLKEYDRLDTEYQAAFTNLVEAVIAPKQPAPIVPTPVQADTKRYEGTINYWNAKSDYGFIYNPTLHGTVKVTRGQLLGMRATGRLHIEVGALVEFTLNESGHNALRVVLVDIPASREAYEALGTPMTVNETYAKRKQALRNLWGNYK